MFENIFYKVLQNKKFRGALVIKNKNKEIVFGDKSSGASVVEISVLDQNFFKRVILFGDTGFGEAYFLEEFETNDLKKLLLWFVNNKEQLPSFQDSKVSNKFFGWGRFLLRKAHRNNKNTKKGSKKNIKAHYDVSNDFYRLWLDDTMTYSAALFEGGANLKEAQRNKYKKICEGIDLRDGERLLEIGSGWGGFSIYAAKNYDCKITTVTISEEQFNYAKQKIEEEGLSDSIDIQLKDYRDLDGDYDKIVSIEMMEALGNEFVPSFIKKCNELLKPGAQMGLQFITYPDRDFQLYLDNPNFIKKHIFPGGELLSLQRTKKTVLENNLSISSLKSIGEDYAKTLNIWRKNLLDKKGEILKLGFDKYFIKKWEYYFVYCEVGFETSYIDDYQMFVAKNNN